MSHETIRISKYATTVLMSLEYSLPIESTERVPFFFTLTKFELKFRVNSG